MRENNRLISTNNKTMRYLLIITFFFLSCASTNKVENGVMNTFEEFGAPTHIIINDGDTLLIWQLKIQ